jgi:energy-coupling factor transporter ATP-binding protein EcfA2
VKVIKLQAENFKRLKAISINPDGNMVIVSGANGQGKSSVLDAIWAAVSGADMSKSTGTTKPIRDGEDKARVQVDLGDMIVTRKWTASGSTLTVENKDGAVYKSPQTILDGLVGKVAFDPLAFAQMDDRKQRETLLGIVNIGIDLDELAASRKLVYDARTVLNRTAQTSEGALKTMPIVPGDTPENEIPASEVINEINVAHKTIRDNDNVRAQPDIVRGAIAQADAQMQKLSSEIERRENEIASLKKDLSGYVATKEELSQKLVSADNAADALRDPDLDALNYKAEKIEEINRNVRIKKERETVSANIKATSKKADGLTAEIEALDKRKGDALLSAKFPIDGLSFDNNGVTFKGIPFSQCSSAERLRTSIAMAMAMNPKLRVIRITDGSLIDSKNMAIIEEMVKEKDFQCWIERVDETGKIGIYIEDGEVKGESK